MRLGRRKVSEGAGSPLPRGGLAFEPLAATGLAAAFVLITLGRIGRTGGALGRSVGLQGCRIWEVVLHSRRKIDEQVEHMSSGRPPQSGFANVYFAF